MTFFSTAFYVQLASDFWAKHITGDDLGELAIQGDICW